jgi:hypothetical protein
MAFRHAIALVVASLFTTASAHAFPGFDIGDFDPCDIVPLLCEPIDPCELAPELCEPPDPCETNPLLCNPIDVCELAPQLCEGEPPVLEPEEPEEVFPFASILTGTAKVKGDGFKTEQNYQFAIVFSDTAFTAFDDQASYAGSLVAKGTSGAKFQIYLDTGSSDAFTEQVAGRAAAATGRAAGPVLGDSTKLILRRREDGTASLKIKSEVLVSGLGEVVFKANVTGPVSVD